jgi:hypothetical protein
LQLTSNDGDTASISKSFFKTKKSLMNSQYTNSRQVQLSILSKLSSA